MKCVYCFSTMEKLITYYGDDCQQERCSCGEIGDPYLEFDNVILILDMFLFKSEIYIHLLYNLKPNFVKLWILVHVFECYIRLLRMENSCLLPKLWTQSSYSICDLSFVQMYLLIFVVCSLETIVIAIVFFVFLKSNKVFLCILYSQFPKIMLIVAKIYNQKITLDLLWAINVWVLFSQLSSTKHLENNVFVVLLANLVVHLVY